MALKDRLGELEARSDREFEHRCRHLAEVVRLRAVYRVEDAIRRRSYELRWGGLLWSKRLKRVSGRVPPVVVWEDCRKETPWLDMTVPKERYIVRDEAELETLIQCIRSKLEEEGFTCQVEATTRPRESAAIFYKMEWEAYERV